jgi:putative FmdB family regulatory protein
MPLYDYKCRNCSKVTEVRHGFRESHLGACPSCGGELARVFNPAGIVFKGSGFYVTDSRKQASDAASASSSTAASAEKSASEKPSSDKPSSDKPSSEKPAAPAASASASDSGSKKSDASAA